MKRNVYRSCHYCPRRKNCFKKEPYFSNCEMFYVETVFLAYKECFLDIVTQTNEIIWRKRSYWIIVGIVIVNWFRVSIFPLAGCSGK